MDGIKNPGFSGVPVILGTPGSANGVYAERDSKSEPSRLDCPKQMHLQIGIVGDGSGIEVMFFRKTSNRRPSYFEEQRPPPSRTVTGNWGSLDC